MKTRFGFPRSLRSFFRKAQVLDYRSGLSNTFDVTNFLTACRRAHPNRRFGGTFLTLTARLKIG